MQLRPDALEGAVDDGVGVGVFGVTVPVTVGDSVGEGVVNGPRIVNDRLALRCVDASLATMVCCPLDHDGAMLIVASNVPSLRALMLLLPADGTYNCANECIAWCAWSVKAIACVNCGLTTKTGVVASNVSSILPPGKKWLPCRCNVPPEVTLLLPLNERLGAKSVRPSPIMLAMMTSGMMIAAIIKVGAQPCLGEDPDDPDDEPDGGWWGCSVSVGDEVDGKCGVGETGDGMLIGGACGATCKVPPCIPPCIALPGACGVPDTDGTLPTCGVPSTDGTLPPCGNVPIATSPIPSRAARLRLSSSSSPIGVVGVSLSD